MYSTCFYCLAALGHNDALELFPVGRRLAFDPVRGRLWAVCDGCGRWNLAPIEERWSAVEECERRYRATHQRYGTDNIGLAGLPDGTELVRIGPALRPEIAAWRYGARLMRANTSRRESFMRASTAVFDAGARATRWLGARPARVSTEERVLRLATGISGPGHRGDRVLAIVPREGNVREGAAREGTRAILRRRHLATAMLVRPERGEPWALEVAHELGTLRLSGSDGLRTGAKLFAIVNQYSGSAALIDAAVRKVDDAMEPDGYFRRVLDSAWRWQWGRSATRAIAAADADTMPTARAASATALAEPARASLAEDLAVQLTGRSFWAHGGIGSAERIALLRMPAVDRLALEMVAHEAAERAALDEELATLLEAWRDAEEIAAIADAL